MKLSVENNVGTQAPPNAGEGTEIDVNFLEISLIISIKWKIPVNFDSATVLKIYPTYVLATESKDTYIERLLSVCIHYM